MTISELFSKYLSDETGATAIEYGLIAALIAVGLIGGATAFSGALNGMFTDVDSSLVEALDNP